MPYLQPGTYRLTVEAAGFKRYVRDGIVVRIGEIPRVDVALEVGAVTESVNVSGAAPLLETETAGAGQVLDGDLLVKIPVSQKRAIRILFYMPGANAIGGFTVLGQRSRAMGYTVDGINGKEPGIGNTNGTDAQISTTQDAFEEVKLYTTGVPAEHGHSAGGLMSIVFKSGTNQFHGSAENRFIGKSMIHRNYLEQLPRTNPFAYHETTFLFSGPVVLPKLQRARQDVLAGRMGAAFRERRHDRRRAPRSPPPRCRTATSPSAARPVRARCRSTIRSPRGRRESTWVRDLFPGNIVPKSLFDPVAVNFLGKNPFTPANQPGIATATGPTENLVMNRSSRFAARAGTARSITSSRRITRSSAATRRPATAPGRATTRRSSTGATSTRTRSPRRWTTSTSFSPT